MSKRFNSIDTPSHNVPSEVLGEEEEHSVLLSDVYSAFVQPDMAGSPGWGSVSGALSDRRGVLKRNMIFH